MPFFREFLPAPIFYYIADERVDFRQLIKVLADAFKVRIEMKQIGARQEAGRIGGIGPCGRPPCEKGVSIPYRVSTRPFSSATAPEDLSVSRNPHHGLAKIQRQPYRLSPPAN